LAGRGGGGAGRATQMEIMRSKDRFSDLGLKRKAGFGHSGFESSGFNISDFTSYSSGHNSRGGQHMKYSQFYNVPFIFILKGAIKYSVVFRSVS
jgi:hypothetical protein